MKVSDIYDVLTKQEYWSIHILDLTAKQIAYCNETYKWESIPDVIKGMEVTGIMPSTSSLFLWVSVTPEAAYLSEERCLMDGYEYVYEDPKLGPVYAIKKQTPNDGYAEYSYAVIER